MNEGDLRAILEGQQARLKASWFGGVFRVKGIWVGGFGGNEKIGHRVLQRKTRKKNKKRMDSRKIKMKVQKGVQVSHNKRYKFGYKRANYESVGPMKQEKPQLKGPGIL